MYDSLFAKDYPEICALELECGQLLYPNRNESFQPFYNWCKRQPDFRRLSADIRDSVENKSYCVVKSLPVDMLKTTKPMKSTRLSEMAMICATIDVGQPYGYRGQRDGKVVQDITPIPDVSEEVQSGSNKNYLEWHTEDAGLKYNCDYVALYCLRNDPETTTILCNLRNQKLSSSTLELLMQPLFNITADMEYKNYMENPQPVLSMENGKRDFRVDPIFTGCITSAAKAALDELLHVANREKFEILLQPGDLLVFDNRACIHGRGKILYKTANELRWLQRVMLFEKEIPDHLLDRERMNIVLERL